jgi:hypothetical protein
VFERFTDRARRVVVLAQEEARLLNHNYIGTEHVLLGLIHEGEGIAADVLESLGISADAVRDHVQRLVGEGNQSPSGHIPFTPRAKKVLELSLREALQLGHNYIGTEHILLGLMREGEGVAAQVHATLGADIAVVRMRVVERLGEPGPVRVVPGASRPERGPVRWVADRPPERCSFCGRDLWEVGHHVASESAAICHECVAAAQDVIEQATAADDPGFEALRLPPRVFGPPPLDDLATEKVRRAFEVALGSEAPEQERIAHVEDGAVVVPVLIETSARYPLPVRADVRAVRFVDEAHANVRFVVHVGLMGPMPFTGDAVLEGGRWQVSRATVATLLARAGVTLPPPADED